MNRTREFVILVSFGITVLLTYLSNTGIYGATNAEVSFQRPTPLTPAPWAFAIWGAIFSSQGAAIFYTFLDSANDDAQELKSRYVKQVMMAWIGGWAFQTLWQFAFVMNNRISLTISALLLIGAVGVFHKALQNAYAIESDFGLSSPLPWWSRAIFTGATSVNAAWLAVATSVGVLIAISVNSSVNLTPVAIGLALAVAATGVQNVLMQKDVYYGAALIWSYVGVYVAHGGEPYVKIACAVSAAVLTLCTLSVTVRAVMKKGADSGGEGGDAGVVEQLVPESS